MEIGGSFGDFASAHPLPRAWARNPRLFDGILQRWFGKDAVRSRADIDGSLAWLLDADDDQRVRRAAKDGWHDGSTYTPRWSPGAPALPTFTVVPLLGEEEQQLAHRMSRTTWEDEAPMKAGPALLVYYGHNHHQVSTGAKAGSFELFMTDHAVAVRDVTSDRSSWVYVCTDQGKLRTRRLAGAVTDGTLVAIETDVFVECTQGHKLVVVDPRTGRWIWRDDLAVRGWAFANETLRNGSRSFTVAQLWEHLSRPVMTTSLRR